MSGIAGVIRLDGIAMPEPLEAMLRPMRRRGPDRQAVACIGQAGFAHALLATTPEAVVEAQPWRHPESGCLLVADSRLDNRTDLLRMLDINRHADDVGDCELLHAAWQRWGEDCADRLRGDFAFALWHPGRRELYAARDVMGVRPFAFHFAPGRLFAFGSTTEVVMAQGEVPTALDEGRIADALIAETEGIDAVCTFYKAVRRLPPAHWLRLREGRIEQRRYWQPVGKAAPSDLPRNEAEWIEAQRAHLNHAVRLRLRSNRRVGAMLSGGLDSSAVVALAARTHAGAKLFPVFPAIDSGHADCAETRHIHAVTAHVPCMPTWVDLATFQQAPMTTPDWWDAGLEPFDGGMTMIGELYRAASNAGTICVLDGVPADNLYAIGQQARQLLRMGHWRQAWKVALDMRNLTDDPSYLSVLKTLAGCVMPQAVRGLRQWRRDRHDFQVLLERSPVSAALARREALWRRYCRYRQGIDDGRCWDASGMAMSSMGTAYITAAIERYNRVASLFGVEPRHPFADRDLIEFQAWMPLPLRIRNGHRKWVLRQAMANDLPETVRWRQDKEHLGWRFSQAQLARDWPSADALGGPLMADWIELPPLATGATRTGVDDAAPGLFTAYALGRWLRNQRFPVRDA